MAGVTVASEQRRTSRSTATSEPVKTSPPFGTRDAADSPRLRSVSVCDRGRSICGDR
jgi:hypothetical protein